jgi:hypothetical protein
MKMLIAKSVMKEGSPLLENLFKPILVISKQVFEDIVEYEIDGPAGTVEPKFDGKEFYFNEDNLPEKFINLAEPGTVLADFGKEGKTKVAPEKPEKPKKKPSAKIPKAEGPGSEEESLKITIKDKKPEKEPERFEVIKPDKIKNKEGEFMKPGEIFTEEDLAEDMTTPQRMKSWHWCIELTD